MRYLALAIMLSLPFLTFSQTYGDYLKPTGGSFFEANEDVWLTAHSSDTVQPQILFITPMTQGSFYIQIRDSLQANLVDSVLIKWARQGEPLKFYISDKQEVRAKAFRDTVVLNQFYVLQDTTNTTTTGGSGSIGTWNQVLGQGGQFSENRTADAGGFDFSFSNLDTFFVVSNAGKRWMGGLTAKIRGTLLQNRICSRWVYRNIW